MSHRLGLLGHPVAHSKSPRIHQAFAASLGLELSYEAIDVEPGTFAALVEALFTNGYHGFNVTVPYKEEAYVAVDRLSDRARLAAAVNTLLRTPEGILGDNTDGYGLVHDIVTRHGIALRGQRILVLGAGGAVRGVLDPVLKEQPASVTIANRTQVKAEQLAAIFATQGEIQATPMADLRGPFDIIINGTAASLGGDVPDLPAELCVGATLVYDMMYGAEDTAFLRWAKTQQPKQCLDGLGMLVSQAAESFRLWTGHAPDAEPVLQRLREELSQPSGLLP
ncbi:shikimate dehydrogenase [Salinispirillum sp. LH 10-3-1]|uniref:Shikimate dehydrogenase (NADP(+)) n=1 Tax=Salinispirillum sp. LH 10-3-1 TaxID=2952525 RepID=A0AB38YFU4_9GAMM